MREVDQKKLIRQAVTRHFVEWAYLEVGECRLALGNGFRSVVESFVQKRDAQVGIFEDYFAGLEGDNLLAAAGKLQVEGFGLIEDEIARIRDADFSALKPRTRIILIAIGVYPEEAADYKMWGLRDSFESKELMWLSLGFEPTENLSDSLTEFRNGSGKLDPFIGKEALKRLEIINRSRTLAAYGRYSVDGRKALDWLNSIDLDVPSGFRLMLETSHERLTGEAVSGQGKSEIETGNFQMDPRALRSLSKLIAAIAIEEYGWNPADKRSPIPGELESICDRQGLSVSRETILKYLRMGVSQSKGRTN